MCFFSRDTILVMNLIYENQFPVLKYSIISIVCLRLSHAEPSSCIIDGSKVWSWIKGIRFKFSLHDLQWQKWLTTLSGSQTHKHTLSPYHRYPLPAHVDYIQNSMSVCAGMISVSPGCVAVQPHCLCCGAAIWITVGSTWHLNTASATLSSPIVSNWKPFPLY